MRNFTRYTPIFLGLFCLILWSTGCKKPQHEQSIPTQVSSSTEASDNHHAGLHQSKYNEVLVEFPGHRYAMEIIDEKETTGLVTAFLTDAHFEPVEVDTTEVRLNFIVDGAPKTYSLVRVPKENGKPAIFTLTDMELATLNCEGWKGEATATIEVSGTPYSAKLIKLGHDHDHGH